jgi:hypothetical protein
MENVSWPQTPQPGCFAKELFDETFRHRGFATVEENEGGVTYWEAWAAADLMVRVFCEKVSVIPFYVAGTLFWSCGKVLLIRLCVASTVVFACTTMVPFADRSS